MNKKNTIMLAVAGVALAAASQAQAQLTYSDGDLLLSFRTSSGGGNDVTVDLGPAGSFVSTVAALPGGTAVLDTGNGYSATAGINAFSGTAMLNAALGNGITPSTSTPLGVSAAAGDTGAAPNNLWMTQVISSPTLSALGGTAPQSSANQFAVGQNLDSIGQASGGSQLANSTTGKAISISSGTSGSFQLVAVDGTGNVNYGANGNGVSYPPAVETVENGTGNVYDALWLVTPSTGRSGRPGYVPGTDMEEGYFTVKPDGEVDFTTAVSAVPEPSTYGAFAAVGLLALSLRRQFRSLIA